MPCTQSTRKRGSAVVGALVVIGGLCAQIPPKHPHNQHQNERDDCLAVLDAIYDENGDFWIYAMSRTEQLSGFIVLSDVGSSGFVFRRP